MTDRLFVEKECHFGGCACGVWSEWWEALREFAMTHPRGQALRGLTDADTYAEAIDTLAVELEPEFQYLARPCEHVECARAA
jgi:hypothetical protein